MSAVSAAVAPPGAGYRGRFAPTPSGPLHLGSLLTALAGWLQARVAGGQWLLRIDDLDAERSSPQHENTILHQLEAHALHWDGSPRRQSQHRAEYEAAFARLCAAGRVYPCACTRAQLAAQSLPGIDGPVYAGTCRAGGASAQRVAWRFRVGTGALELDDPWRGRVARDVGPDVGDFVVWRADGTPGYQLACVIDEAAQGINEVVRGSDLLGSSLRQLLLHAHLDLRAPGYAHLPVLNGADGRKLSKQNHAAAAAAEQAGSNLLRCLRLLGQAPPAQLAGAGPAEICAWAQQHWQTRRIPSGPAIELDAATGELGAAAAHLAS